MAFSSKGACFVFVLALHLCLPCGRLAAVVFGGLGGYLVAKETLGEFLLWPSLRRVLALCLCLPCTSACCVVLWPPLSLVALLEVY